jgi:hypothetical protein
VSSVSIKNATAISHGSSRLLEAASEGGPGETSIGPGELTFVGVGCIGLRDRIHPSSFRERPIIADPSLDSVDASVVHLFRDFRVPAISACLS